MSGQDPKEKTKGTLPQGWKALGLSDEQRKKIYAIEAEYRSKIDELNKKVADLKKEERKKMEEVLTEPQKDQLRKSVLQTDDKKPEDKKPSDKKSDDKKPQ